MFMNKEEWSDDEMEDTDDMVVPMPQVISSGNSGADPQYRASAYNERMARARNAARKTSNTGIVQTNSERPPRPSTASRAAPIDVLSQEVEEMELEHSQSAPRRAYLTEDSEEPYDSNYAAADMLASATYDDSASSHHEETPPPPAPPAAHIPAAPLPAPPQQQQQQQQAQMVPRPIETAPAVIDTSDLRAFLMRPGPQGAMVQCYIQRRKSGLARLYPTYEVYLKDGEQFLLSARRRKKQKQSNYKVSLDRDDLSRHSSNYFGKLKSNFMGTEFQMYDNGINPEKLSEAQRDGTHVQVRQELATVLYKQNVLGSRGPRKMKVMVPNVDENGQRVCLRPTDPSESMLERYKAAKNDNDVQILKNKQPKWNDQVGAYVLNFNGRVTRASVKNFQLCNVARDPDHVVMQFGRVGKDAFTMDYQWPLCGLQAFGIALSSFDYKIACE
uniref:Tubby C-terminal domain-containing protein n=1 Tax=Haptolina brevifila TaxID=156173 RepID=A0A7S2G0K3_9EUKA|mmetsp:Transcript_2493/g.5166  ORF Transcript_2493/g.5166 Transcript_2493/m.5166 type:complete len:444 (+) Transcript_2493:164-1495(+)